MADQPKQITCTTCYKPGKVFPAPLVSVNCSTFENRLAWLVRVDTQGATVQWYDTGDRSRFFKRHDLEPVTSEPRLSQLFGIASRMQVPA